MLNTATLEQLKQDVGQDLLVTLVTIFIKETDQALDKFPSSVQSEQQRISHSLKSSALSYGVDEVGLLSKHLEQLIKDNNESEVCTVFNQLLHAWDANKALLHNYIL